MKKSELGRSMVEMLSVLAIIGVLSVGGVVGYSVAVQRIRANNIIDVASKLSAKGLGGRTFDSLKTAGLTEPEGIKMSIDREGIICVTNFKNSTTQDKRFFSAFKAQATKQVVDCPTTTPDKVCDVCLHFSNPLSSTIGD